jgi:hypothetical protein
MGARNRVEIRWSYWAASLHRLAESIPGNRFQGSLNVEKYLLCYWKQKEQRQKQLGAEVGYHTNLEDVSFLCLFPSCIFSIL